jgi:hypothetical protein
MDFLIDTECAHSGRPMRIEIDAHLGIKAIQSGADPIVFSPKVNLMNTEQPSIINIY